MDGSTFAIIYFFYGLAFFSMGLAIFLELDQCSDIRLRHALRPLAVFGFLHGTHEWLEMFDIIGFLHSPEGPHLAWEGVRLALLAFSFLSLAAFGASLLARDERRRRYSLIIPIFMVAIWIFGLLVMSGIYPRMAMINVADVWTRYVLAIPAAIIASVGLIYQQREFRRAGMAQFGRDSLWAAIAFTWYGLIGQLFTRTSPLPPSNVINQSLFYDLFGFPVQLLRAGAAILVAIFVIRFLRSFEFETKQRINQLQGDRLAEAKRREALRGDLLRRIVEAQESERQRIARELHDETGQALTAIGLGLRGVSTNLRQDVDKSAHNLRQLEGLVTQSLNELARVIADLRPSHLDDLGLAATLRWYAVDVRNRAPLEVNVVVVGEERPLPSEVKTALFRVTQEALTNTIKHANAHQAHIRLVYGGQNVSVRVEDDGCGFDLNHLDGSNRTAWGLLGMEERASLLGGSFTITSSPGQGSIVEVVIPYDQQVESEFDEDTPVVS